MPMQPQPDRGFSCEPCRQLVQVHRVDRHQYLASIQAISVQHDLVRFQEEFIKA